jgi:hypothetical protein
MAQKMPDFRVCAIEFRCAAAVSFIAPLKIPENRCSTIERCLRKKVMAHDAPFTFFPMEHLWRNAAQKRYPSNYLSQ